MSVMQSEIAEFEEQADRWFAEHKPGNPGFILPETFMEVGTDQQFEFLRNWQQKVYENGYVGMSWPKEYGGLGMDQVFQDIATKAMAKHRVPFLPNTIGLNWAGPLILAMGSDEEKSKYIKGILSAEDIWCQGFSEPDHGSDLGSAQCKAAKDGDEYVINGSKLYITNGPVADICLLYAKTERDAGSKGITAFVVETATPGFKVAQKLTKMGFRGSQTAELVFEDMVVPRRNIVGTEHQGHRVVMCGLDYERAAIAPINVGVAERALELAVDYAKTRKQFDQPISQFQMVQSRIADMYVWVETMKTFCWQVLEEAQNVDQTQAGRGQIHARTAASVMYCADMCNKVLDSALQIHGGSGYIWESEINRLFRSTKLLEIGAGTTEVRKMIIAEEVLNS